MQEPTVIPFAKKGSPFQCRISIPSPTPTPKKIEAASAPQVVQCALTLLQIQMCTTYIVGVYFPSVISLPHCPLRQC